MTDGIQRGAGNAYRLQAPANALSLYPTHESLVEALASGEFFADLKLNPEGWNPLGTSLSKANLLKDTTAALYGKSAAAVPDEIFAAIRQLITTAQNTANSAQSSANKKAYYSSGLYEGTSYGAVTNNQTIYFTVPVAMLFIWPSKEKALYIINSSLKTAFRIYGSGASDRSEYVVDFGSNYITFSGSLTNKAYGPFYYFTIG